ncbi:MAG: protein-disulfide reductase DsbD domain-containing protein, partial [Luteimonas sp.]
MLLLSSVFGAAWAASPFTAWSGQDTGAEFLDAEDVFVPEPPVREGNEWKIQAQIAEGYYVYRHALRAQDAAGEAVELTLPAGTPRHDEFFGDTEVYLPPGMTLGLPTDASGPLTLYWQG